MPSSGLMAARLTIQCAKNLGWHGEVPSRPRSGSSGGPRLASNLQRGVSSPASSMSNSSWADAKSSVSKPYFATK